MVGSCWTQLGHWRDVWAQLAPAEAYAFAFSVGWPHFQHLEGILIWLKTMVSPTPPPNKQSQLLGGVPLSALDSSAQASKCNFLSDSQKTRLIHQCDSQIHGM